MGAHAGDGIRLEVLNHSFIIAMCAAVLALLIIVAYAVIEMVHKSNDKVFVTMMLMAAACLVFSASMVGADDGKAVEDNEMAVASSYGMSDVSLEGRTRMKDLMSRPWDGSWQVSYRDGSGVRRSGRMEITDSESGSPMLRMMDDSGRTVRPRS